VAQPDEASSGRRKRGKQRQGGGKRADVVFNRFAAGKDSFDVNSVTVPAQVLRPGETTDQRREQWRSFLTKKSITDGQMTRELFREYFSERVAQRKGQGKGRRGRRRSRQ
jgi:hypothetical protein